jgi:hypothetical protein
MYIYYDLFASEGGEGGEDGRKVFLSRRACRDHEREKHADSFTEQTYKCDCCGREFKIFNYYLSHLRADRAGVCDLCGKEERDVTHHIRRVHKSPSGILLKCNICPKKVRRVFFFFFPLF